MTNHLPQKLTQHQKRVIIIESLYQYFLESKTEINLATFFATSIESQVDESIASTFKDLIWHQSSIIHQIEQNLKSGWFFKNLKPIEQAILFLGCYEILYTSTKKAIIINEAIILAKHYADTNVYRYINGVLDKINHSN